MVGRKSSERIDGSVAEKAWARKYAGCWRLWHCCLWQWGCSIGRRGIPREEAVQRGEVVKPAASSPQPGAGNGETVTTLAGAGVETSEKKGAATAEPGFTLRPGETLEFAANLPKLNSTVANLKIVVAGKRNQRPEQLAPAGLRSYRESLPHGVRAGRPVRFLQRRRGHGQPAV